MAWYSRIRSLFGQQPVHEAAGRGRRALAWMPGNPGAVAAMLATSTELRIKSRDLVRRNAWAQAGIEAFVANAVGTGIKPQSLSDDERFKTSVQALWRDWVEEADAAGQTDFYGLQALACRAMLEGGECLIRLRPRRPEDGLSVPLQLQLLEPEHLPISLNTDLPSGNTVRSGIEFDAMGRRVAYHLYRSHPEDGGLAPMSGHGGLDTVRIPAAEIIHLYRVLRPGQIRGEPWLSRALVKLNELDQYDDAELVRKKTAAMFAGFVTRQNPEDSLMGEGAADADGISLAGLEPGTLQILEPGEDIKFSDPADVGGSYSEFLRTQFRAVAAAIGITYEQLTGDLTGVNYSSIRAGMLEFRRRCEMVQHGVLVHQLCRPVWAAWMKQAVLAGALDAPGFARGGPARRRQYLAAKWVPQGWQWVDPEKEFKAMLLAIRAGLMVGLPELATPADYAPPVRQPTPATGKVAVIPIHGTLVRRTSGLEAASGLASYTDIAAQIDAALASPDVAAILLDVDSPGGESGGVFDLADRIRAAAQMKPVWAVANDMAFSAAYALASAASRVFVARTGGVGSIGVIAMHVDQSVKDAKDGLHYTAVFAGERKNDLNPHEPISSEAHAVLKAEVDRIYGLFVETVARHRGIEASAVRDTEAGLFFGESAIAAGLADAVGSFDEALVQLLASLSPNPTSVALTTRAGFLAAGPSQGKNAPLRGSKPQAPRGGLLSCNHPKESLMNDRTDTAALDGPLADPAGSSAQPSAAATLNVADAIEIAQTCTLAGRADLIAGFLETNTAPATVRSRLLATQAEASPEITSRIAPDAARPPASNPLIDAAKHLAAQSASRSGFAA